MDALREALKTGKWTTPQECVIFPTVGEVYRSEALNFKKDVGYSRGRYSTIKDKKLTLLNKEESFNLASTNCVGVKVCESCHAVYPHSKHTCCKQKKFIEKGHDCPGEPSAKTSKTKQKKKKLTWEIARQCASTLLKRTASS